MKKECVYPPHLSQNLISIRPHGEAGLWGGRGGKCSKGHVENESVRH